MVFRRSKGIAAVVVALLAVVAISGNALAVEVSALDFARWNAVPLTDDAMEKVTGEGWATVAKAVGSFIVSTIVSLELERAGVFEWYSEVRDKVSEYVNDMLDNLDTLYEYDKEYNPRNSANLPSFSCPRCDAINAAKQKAAEKGN